MSSKFKKITLYTTEVDYSTVGKIKAIRHPLVKALKQKKDPLGGSYSLLKSLERGFESLGINYNLNPSFSGQIGDVVWVIGNKNALKHAIDLKKKGKIKYLIAGPTIITDAEVDKELVCTPHLDLFIVHSEWIRDIYLDVFPALEGKIKLWPAGVDQEFWIPQEIERKQVLIYKKIKRRNSDNQSLFPDELYNDILHFFEAKNIEVKVLEHYTFNRNDFREELQKSICMVYMYPSETQGISLAESWCMDTPTLVWDYGVTESFGKTYPCSSAPFLTDKTGFFFKSIKDFESGFENLENCNSREWVLENMTDKRSSGLFLKILDDLIL